MLRKIISLKTIDSTNNYIANLITEGKMMSGTVVLAERQSNGKGQRSASWESEDGKNITASLYLQLNSLDISNAFSLSMLVAITLCRYVRDLGINAQVKWPNDLIVNRKKIAGILIENQLQGTRIASSIVGIGLNVNQSTFSLPNITSIFNETGKNRDIRETTIDLFAELSEALHSNSFDFQKISNEYYNYLFGFQEQVRVRFIAHDSVQVIRLVGVEPNGLLKAELKTGELKYFDLKELKFDLQNEF